MLYLTPTKAATALLLAAAAHVHSHVVILKAQGLKDSPASRGMALEDAISRDCIDINPCQQDTPIIRDAEIADNVVNFCGRTQIGGNIDVGAETEKAIQAGAVTQVSRGSTLEIVLHQVNADGAGPYFCDLDQTSNTGTISHNLTVENNVPGENGLSTNKIMEFTISVILPDDLACTGGSTGNICTVRCRNAAHAGPFGGCVPVEQTDVQPAVNEPQDIKTKTTLEKVNSLLVTNQGNFANAVKAHDNSNSEEAVQNLAEVMSILKVSVPGGNNGPKMRRRALISRLMSHVRHV